MTIEEGIDARIKYIETLTRAQLETAKRIAGEASVGGAPELVPALLQAIVINYATRHGN